MFGAQFGLAVTILADAAIAVLIWNGVKILVPLRAWFNAWAIDRWANQLEPGGSEMWTDRWLTKKARARKKRRRELIRAATADGRRLEQRALLGQPTPKILGVLQVTAAAILDSGDRQELLEILTGTQATALKDEPSAGVVPASEPPTPPPPTPTAPSIADDLRTWLSSKASPKEPNAQDMAARDRVELRMERRLDALQTSLDYRWGTFNKLYTSAFAAEAGLVSFGLQGAAGWSGLAKIVAVVGVAAVFGAIADHLAARSAA